MPATAPAVGDEALQHWISRVRGLGGISLQRVAALKPKLEFPPSAITPAKLENLSTFLGEFTRCLYFS